MQAIQTKFLGPTNTKGSRVKAICWLTSVVVSWDYSANVEENHMMAINTLIDNLNNERIIKGNSTQWQVVATGESVDGKGITAIIDLQ